MRRRRNAGTSLVEILVVIVVFLIGILAVLQIFPKGLRLLGITDKNTRATALGRSEIERLKESPEQLPEQVLSTTYDGTSVIELPGRSPNDLGPLGDSVAADGTLTSGGTALGYWLRYAGPNIARRIVGEGMRVPSPRPVGADYGGLAILKFGPIDISHNATGGVIAYGNDLTRSVVLPREPVDTGSTVAVSRILANGSIDSFNGPLFAVNANLTPYEFFADNFELPSTGAHTGPLVLLPGGEFDRQYRISFTATFQNGSKTYNRTYVDVSATVAALTSAQVSGLGVSSGLVKISLVDLISPLAAGEQLMGIEAGTLRAAPQFKLIPNSANFDDSAYKGDPFVYKNLDPYMGVLLFSPYGYATTIERPGGAREPLQARMNYDVYDWRILKEDFRPTLRDGYGMFQLAVPSIKTGTQSGPDGLAQEGNALYEGQFAQTQDALDDHLMVMDLTTGGILYEKDPVSSARLITIDKSRGVVTFNDANTGKTGLQGLVQVPGTTGGTEVDLDRRPLRVFYMTNNEYAVQLIKASSSYLVVDSASNIAQGQCYPGPGTRLYFPAADVNRKVNLGTLFYKRTGDTSPRELTGQDFVIQSARAGDSVGLPYIDIQAVDPLATAFDTSYGYAVRDVKGASVAVRVLWNSDKFSLSNDTAKNMAAIDQWGRSWHKNVTETYLQKEAQR